MTRQQATRFTSKLLDWHQRNPRPLPWKETNDPYLIWLSEIILQQTRVEQGTPYFEAFRKAYPSVSDLAMAPIDEVLKLWEGLGYYSRARNLHHTAKYIADELNGQFPTNYDDILKLKGIGPYTAAAIASFAFKLPHAVVDGNVYRVLSRIFGIDTPIDSTIGKKAFAELAQSLIDKKRPDDFNQALMDFGATQCVPKSPSCESCDWNEDCVAYLQERIPDFPVKSKAKPKKNRYFQYLVLNYQDQTLIEKRAEKDIWEGLYQFPLIETSEAETSKAAIQSQVVSLHPSLAGMIEAIRGSKPYKQTLSHRYIHATFWEIDCKILPKVAPDNTQIIPRNSISSFAFPKIIDWYLGDKTLYLELL